MLLKYAANPKVARTEMKIDVVCAKSCFQTLAENQMIVIERTPLIEYSGGFCERGTLHHLLLAELLNGSLKLYILKKEIKIN